jgi:CIC family chloride channel protein
VPLIKLVASALTIGSGGSGGREGPIALIGAGFGSYLGKLLRLRSAERRVLVAAGMGAGVGAIFRAPLAGALFAAEILYRSPEFESEVILPAGLACVVSYCTFGMFYQGWKPLFDIDLKLGFDNPLELLPYLVLALWMALLAAMYTRTFYSITRRFRKLPIPTVLKPAIGGLGTGLVGVLLYLALNHNEQALAVMSFGYGILQDGLKEPFNLSAGLLLAVALGKILTTSLTIGSGGSGGVFGPSMVIGGCGGLSLGLVLHSWWPSLVPQPANFMILGMAGFFAAAGKVPFSTLVMVSEITGGYTLILPALWVCILSYLVSDEQSLYSAQVATRSRSPAHQGEYIRDVLTGFQVQQFLKPNQELLLVRPNDRLETLLDVLDEGAGPVVAVVDDQQQLVGAVNLEEVYLAISSPNTRPWVLVADMMRSNIVPLQATHQLDEALELFAENDLPALPVVEGPNSRRVVAMIRRGEIARQYVRLVHGKKPSGILPVPAAPKE